MCYSVARVMLTSLQAELNSDPASLPFILQRLDRDGSVLTGPPGYQVCCWCFKHQSIRKRFCIDSWVYCTGAYLIFWHFELARVKPVFAVMQNLPIFLTMAVMTTVAHFVYPRRDGKAELVILCFLSSQPDSSLHCETTDTWLVHCHCACLRPSFCWC